MSTSGNGFGSPDPRSVERALEFFRRQSVLAQDPAAPGTPSTSFQGSTQPPTPTTPCPPRLTTDQSQPTTPGITFCTDVAILHSVIGALQAELNATASVNSNLAASVSRLQAELNAATSVNNHLAATVARFQAEQAPPTPATTTPTATPAPTTMTSTPFPCSHPDHPRTSGRGAASVEVFQKTAKTNWHGRLGRTHMAEVDALPAAALTELDSFLRRKLYQIYPRGGSYSPPEVDTIFASLATLGLQLEDRSPYADLPNFTDHNTKDAATLWRGRQWAGWFYSRDASYVDYWKGYAVETLLELARYRGLFDDEGFLI